MTSHELPVERFESTPIEGTDLVDLVITYRDPNTGQVRPEQHGPDGDGNYRTTFTHVPETDIWRHYFLEETP